MTSPTPLVLRQDARDENVYRVVQADVEPVKYTLVPEGDLFRIFANRQVGNQTPGTPGGLVSGPHILDHQDNSWISDDSRVVGISRVTGDSYVIGGCSLHDTSVDDGSKLMGSRTKNSVVARGSKVTNSHIEHSRIDNTIVEDSTVNMWHLLRCKLDHGTRLERHVEGFEQNLSYAQLRNAHVFYPDQVVTVVTSQGFLTMARGDGPSGYTIRVGCQTYDSIGHFLEGARRYGVGEFDNAMLEPLSEMLLCATRLWRKP